MAEAAPARPSAASATTAAVRERIKPAPIPEQAWRDPAPAREVAADVAEASAPPLPEPPAPPPADWSEPAYEEERPRRRYRRNPARMWTWAAVIAAVVMSAAVGAIWWIGPQQVVAWTGVETSGAENRLALSGQARRENLPSNQELVTVTGEVRNLTGETQRVPQIRAQLLDAQQRVVFTWSIAPPVRELGPREAVTFEGASTGVPRGGANLSLSFGPQS